MAGVRHTGRNMWLAVGVQSAKGTVAYLYTYLQPVDIEGFFTLYEEIESGRRIGTRFKGDGYVGQSQVPFTFSVELNPGDCGKLIYGATGTEAPAASGGGYTHTFTLAEDLPYLTFLLYASGVADDTGTNKILQIRDCKIKASIEGAIDAPMMLSIEGMGILATPIENVATTFDADITDTSATLADISETDGIWPGMPIAGTGIPAGTVIKSFDTGLTGANLLANTMQATIVAHINDYGSGTEEHIDALDPAGATLTAIAAATTVPTLITLTTGLIAAHVAHDADVIEVTPTYHQATSSANALASAVAPVTLHECIDRLNDIKAKYNLHDADTTSHEDGSEHQEATADADTTAEMSAVATATNTDETVTVSSFSTAASAGFTDDKPYFVKSSLGTGKVSIGATFGAESQYNECRSVDFAIENGLDTDNRIDNTEYPTAIEEGDSEITGSLDCIYNTESFAEIKAFQDNSARAMVLLFTSTNVFDTTNYKTLTINIYRAKYTGGVPTWDLEAMNAELPFRVNVDSGFNMVLFDDTATEYDDAETAI